MRRRFDRRTFIRGAALGTGAVLLPTARAHAARASQADFYVDRAMGRDTNAGTTPGAPFATIAAARTAVLAAARPSRILLSGSTESAPYIEWVSQFSSLQQPLRIRPADDAGHQWLSGATQIASTVPWTDRSGGVFSTPNTRPGPTAGGILWCGDQARSVSIGGRPYPLKLRQTTGTQSAPRSGEYGETGGQLYVKLPALTSPAGATFWLAKLPRAFWVNSNRPNALVTFERLRFRGFLDCAVLLGAPGAAEGTGYVEHVECAADMCGSLGGFATSGVWSRSRSYSCTSERNNNDGFNYHAAAIARPLAQEFDCIGRANGDSTADSAQGTSPHSNVRLQLYGGEYSYNTSGGLVAIDNAIVELRRSTARGRPAITMIGNQRIKDQGGFHAGLGISDTVRATVLDRMAITDSGGPNVKVKASARLTGYRLISSARGGAPDNLSA